MVYSEGMKTTEKGDLGKGLVLADLLRRGFQVALPLAEDSRYDLILDKDGTLLRVQCKAVSPKKGTLIVKCRSTSSWGSKTRSAHKYTKDDIDLLAAVDLSSGMVYYVNAEELGSGRNVLTLRLTPPENGQMKGIRWASEYLDVP